MKVIVALLVLLLIGLQYRLWFGEGSIQEVRRLQVELSEKRDTLVGLAQRNAALEAEVSDLKSGLDAIEERARTELGMISKDETFYQFVRNRGKAAATRPQGKASGATGTASSKPGGTASDATPAPASADTTPPTIGED